MGDYHITIKGGRWLFVLLAGIVLTVISAAAVLSYLFWAYDPLDMIDVRVKLEKQYLKARMEKSFPVTAEIDQMLQVPLQETISVGFPFKQELILPFDKTMELPIELDAVIPVQMTVPFKADIPIDTEIFVDTKIRTSVLGVPFSVPIKGYIPVNTTIPVSQSVEVREDFHLKLHTPVKVNVKDTFILPIEMEIVAQVPLDTTLNLPLKEQFHADISLWEHGEDQIPNLYILDNILDIKIDRIRIVRPE